MSQSQGLALSEKRILIAFFDSWTYPKTIHIPIGILIELSKKNTRKWVL
jgi:hypothetical protein